MEEHTGISAVSCPPVEAAGTTHTGEVRIMKTHSLAKALLFISLLFMPFVSAFSEDAADDWERMVFHLDETANARWALMLSNAYLDDSPRAKLIVVAYGPGIDFLLDDAEDRRGNPYEPAVMDLVAKGVEFRVCATTLAARDIDKDRLLDGATTVPSGLTEIARLQLKEGYAYVKP